MLWSQRCRSLEGCRFPKSVLAVKHVGEPNHAPASWSAAALQALRRFAGNPRAKLPGKSPALPFRTAAFTLIELMVVLVLIGILSAMILPEMRGTYGDALLRSSGRQLINAFELAYSQSVSLNQIHIVRFDQSTGRYQVERRMRSHGNQPEYAPLKDVPGSAGKLDERIRVQLHPLAESAPDSPAPDQAPLIFGETESRPSGSVAFYPDGTADGVEVLLRDREGFGLRLQIDSVTSRIQLDEVPRE
jgi:type II secretion system protein H